MKKEKAFTLIELLVVVSIISILGMLLWSAVSSHIGHHCSTHHVIE